MGEFQEGLKDIFKGDFLIGVALNKNQIYGKEPSSDAIVQKHFNSITPENILKWEEVHPAPGQYNFEAADRFVEYGEKLGLQMIGHTLFFFKS